MRAVKEILISLGIDEDNEAAIEVINEVREEVIKECAERVQQNFNLTIDKQSILNLIKELK